MVPFKTDLDFGDLQIGFRVTSRDGGGSDQRYDWFSRRVSRICKVSDERCICRQFSLSVANDPESFQCEKSICGDWEVCGVFAVFRGAGG